MRFMSVMSVSMLLAMAACDGGDSKESGTSEGDADTDTDTDTETETTETGGTGTGGGGGSFTPAYVAIGGGFGVDANNELSSAYVTGYTSTTYGGEIAPYLVLILASDDFSDQCAMVYDLSAGAASNWDPSAFFGFEVSMYDVALMSNDCDGVMVMGYDASLVFQQDYMMSLAALDSSIADFIDSYPSYYYTSSQVIGGNVGSSLLYEAIPTSFIGFAVDGDMMTDYATMMNPNDIDQGTHAAPGWYATNNFTLIGL